MKDNTDKTLILVGLVCLLLLLMHFLPPISVCGVKLRHVSVLSDLSPHHADTLSNGVLAVPATSTSPSENDKPKVSKNADWPSGVERIDDFSEGGQGGMSHFYAMIDSLQQGKLVSRPLRIAYFSDSYTEGDILTADLRDKLQARYGGSGVGWVDVANGVNQFRLSLSVSDKGMKGHMAMQKDDYQASMAGIAARYAPFRGRASITYEGKHHYAHATDWTAVRLYLRTRGKVKISAHLGELSITKTVENKSVNEVFFDANHSVESTALSLTGTGTVFGASLEGKTGIVLDNFSMRSSSGLPLGNIPDQTLKEFQQFRQYDLVILAFGGNVVSPSGAPDECDWYIKKMKKVVAKYKACFPEVSILLFGAPDFGYRKDDQIVTPESITGLIAWQKRMAAESGIGFYDLQHAMGGNGSAGRLYEQKMVGSDLFHINQRGGGYIAECIFQSLVAGEKNYLNHCRKQASSSAKKKKD